MGRRRGEASEEEDFFTEMSGLSLLDGLGTAKKAVSSFYIKWGSLILFVSFLLNIIAGIVIFKKQVDESQELQQIQHQYELLRARYEYLAAQADSLRTLREKEELIYSKLKKENDSLRKAFFEIPAVSIEPVFGLSPEQSDSFYTNTVIPYLKRRYADHIKSED